MARTGRSNPAMRTSVSMRERVSRGPFEWIVVSDPSWPVFMAWSMSRASPPRTSPTTMRSGRIRRVLRTRSRIVIWPLPLEVGRPGLEGEDVLLVELELGGVLDGDDALVLGQVAGEDVEGRRLPRAGAAGDDDVEPPDDARPEEVGVG